MRRVGRGFCLSCAMVSLIAAGYVDEFPVEDPNAATSSDSTDGGGSTAGAATDASKPVTLPEIRLFAGSSPLN